MVGNCCISVLDRTQQGVDSPVTIPRPFCLCSPLSASRRVGRPLTVTEQKGELRNALHVSPTAATVVVDSKPGMKFGQLSGRLSLHLTCVFVASNRTDGGKMQGPTKLNPGSPVVQMGFYG
jgi:hypothetical protein